MIRPMGSRVLCVDLITTLSVEKRAERVGLVAVVSEAEKPKPTQALVVAVGTDPLLCANVAVGDVVSFSYLAGHGQFINDEQFRALDFLDIITVDDGDGYAKDRARILGRYRLVDGRTGRAERARSVSARTNKDGTDRGGEPPAQASPRESGHK